MNGVIEVVYVHTDDNESDIDTKNCAVKIFDKHARKKRNLND